MFAMIQQRKLFLAGVLTVASVQGAVMFGQSQQPTPRKGAAQVPNSATFTSQITSLVKWVTEITPMLQNQANEADRNKLRNKLRDISQQLASTATINDAVIDNLQSSNLDWNKLQQQLIALEKADQSIADSIAAIRSNLHLDGEATTDLERHASDSIEAKGIGVDKMLSELQYSPARTPAEIHSLREKGEELKVLLRRADDAITAAYNELGTPPRS